MNTKFTISLLFLFCMHYAYADSMDPLVAVPPADQAPSADKRVPAVPAVAATPRAADAAISPTTPVRALPRTTETDAAPAIRRPDPDSSALYRQLVALRSQNAILVESLKNADLRFKLGASGNQPIVPRISQNSGSGNDTVESFGTSARVHLISGSGDKLAALISVPGGGRVTARVGSTIPGVGVVKAISLNEVLIENNNVAVVVPFAADPSDTATPSNLPGNPF